MTAPRKKPTRAERQRKLEKDQRKHVFSPCDRPPEVPAHPAGAFDHKGGGRYHRIRALLHWDEVHRDTSGFNISVDHYVVEWEYSDDDVTYHEAERYHVSPLGDNDPNDKHQYVIKGSILAKLAYRFRVRAVGPHNCKSDWTPYVLLGAPAGDLPPAPVNVKTWDKGVDRIIVDWDAPRESRDNDIMDEKIAHFACELSRDRDFTNTYRKDVFIGHSKTSFKIDDDDVGDIYYARVWSIGVDRDKSIKVPAKLVANSDPFAQPDGVAVGTVLSPGTNIPIGSVHWHAGPTLPPHYLRCNGDSYAIDGTYNQLFAVIAYHFGNGDQHPGNSAFFGVPDMKNRKVVGASRPGGRYFLGMSDSYGEDSRTEADDLTFEDNLDHGVIIGFDGDGDPIYQQLNVTTGTLDVPEHSHPSGNLHTSQQSPGSTDYVASRTGGPAGANDLSKTQHSHDIFGFTGGPAGVHHHTAKTKNISGKHPKIPNKPKHFVILHPIIRAE